MVKSLFKCLHSQGGVSQSEDDVPLTAYVIISLIHAMPVYELGTDTELVTHDNITFPAHLLCIRCWHSVIESHQLFL